MRPTSHPSAAKRRTVALPMPEEAPETNTFFRWVREGLFADVECRDRRGWRLFTSGDLDRLKAEVNKVCRSLMTGVPRQKQKQVVK